MRKLAPFNRRRNEVDIFQNMIDDFFGDSWLPQRSLFNDTFKLDVKENDTEYIVEADVPGVEKDEITISTDDKRVRIGISKTETVDEEKEEYVHRERRNSSMERSIYLVDMSEDNIDARLENGVLKIVIPKAKQTDERKKIEIK